MYFSNFGSDQNGKQEDKAHVDVISASRNRSGKQAVLKKTRNLVNNVDRRSKLIAVKLSGGTFKQGTHAGPSLQTKNLDSGRANKI